MEHNPVCKDVHFCGRGPLACVCHNQMRETAAAEPAAWWLSQRCPQQGQLFVHSAT